MEVLREEADAPVSRLDCVFTFESREFALLFAVPPQVCFEVVPTDAQAPTSRHDSWWVQWLGEPGRSTVEVTSGIRDYWDGRPATSVYPKVVPAWEWLIGGSVRIADIA